VQFSEPGLAKRADFCVVYLLQLTLVVGMFALAFNSKAAYSKSDWALA